VSRGVIRLSTPVWHERGLTRPRRETLLVHMGTRVGLQGWSTNSPAATGGGHETRAEASIRQGRNVIRIYSYCRSTVAAPTKVAIVVGMVMLPNTVAVTSVASTTRCRLGSEAGEGDRTLYSAIRGPCPLIGEAPKAPM